MKGGTVSITAGEGASDQLTDGGDGGDIILAAGQAKGGDKNDKGGRFSITGGAANHGSGGSVEITSGTSNRGPSGDVVIHTANGGRNILSGSSGSLSLITGSSHFEPSGSVTIASGNSSFNNTGSVIIKSGNASHGSGMGGNITLETGYSEKGISGSFSIVTSKSGGSSRFAQTGDIVLETGDTPRGKTGSMLFATGSSGNGASGESNVLILSITFCCFCAPLLTEPKCRTLQSEYQGSFELAIGHSTSNYDGGSISMKAGDTIGEVSISVDSLYTHDLFHILCNLVELN